MLFAIFCFLNFTRTLEWFPTFSHHPICASIPIEEIWFRLSPKQLSVSYCRQWQLSLFSSEINQVNFQNYLKHLPSLKRRKREDELIFFFFCKCSMTPPANPSPMMQSPMVPTTPSMDQPAIDTPTGSSIYGSEPTGTPNSAISVSYSRIPWFITTGLFGAAIAATYQ